MRWLAVAVAAALVAACGGGDSGSAPATEQFDRAVAVGKGMPAPMPPEMMAPADASVATADVATSGLGGGVVPPEPAPDTTGGLYLAYEYRFALELPADQVLPLQQQHIAACRARGPAQCLVIGATSSRADDGHMVTAQLTLRMRPADVPVFQKAMEAEVDKADGTIVDSGVTSQDLTRAIVDTEARLGAQIRLRDRLMGLLDRPTAKVGDLLEVERELARVQGDIESQTSQLKVFRQQVDLSLVALDYRSEPTAMTGGTFESTLQAIRDFFRIISDSLAGVIRFVAGILPWLPVLLAAGFVVRWMWRRWRNRHPGAA